MYVKIIFSSHNVCLTAVAIVIQVIAGYQASKQKCWKCKKMWSG